MNEMHLGRGVKLQLIREVGGQIATHPSGDSHLGE